MALKNWDIAYSNKTIHSQICQKAHATYLRLDGDLPSIKLIIGP